MILSLCLSLSICLSLSPSLPPSLSFSLHAAGSTMQSATPCRQQAAGCGDALFDARTATQFVMLPRLPMCCLFVLLACVYYFMCLLLTCYWFACCFCHCCFIGCCLACQCACPHGGPCPRHGAGARERLSGDCPIPDRALRPVSVLGISKLRFADSNSPGNSL